MYTGLPTKSIENNSEIVTWKEKKSEQNSDQISLQKKNKQKKTVVMTRLIYLILETPEIIASE